MIPMETKFNDDIVVRFSVITENVNFSFIREYRGATLRSPCDVIDDVITTKNTFSCIIWDKFFHILYQIEPVHNMLAFSKWPPF